MEALQLAANDLLTPLRTRNACYGAALKVDSTSFEVLKRRGP